MIMSACLGVAKELINKPMLQLGDNGEQQPSEKMHVTYKLRGAKNVIDVAHCLYVHDQFYLETMTLFTALQMTYSSHFSMLGINMSKLFTVLNLLRRLCVYI